MKLMEIKKTNEPGSRPDEYFEITNEGGNIKWIAAIVGYYSNSGKFQYDFIEKGRSGNYELRKYRFFKIVGIDENGNEISGYREYYNSEFKKVPSEYVAEMFTKTAHACMINETYMK